MILAINLPKLSTVLVGIAVLIFVTIMYSLIRQIKLIFLIVLALIYACFVTSADVEKVYHTVANKLSFHIYADREPIKLARVIDGDTLAVYYNGSLVTVRYLLIDSPEMYSGTVEPFALEAKNYHAELLQKGSLEIEFDVEKKYDKYGRLLAYIYADGQNVQENMLQAGYAKVAYIYPPNTRYLTKFQNAEAKAKQTKLGIWSLNSQEKVQ